MSVATQAQFQGVTMAQVEALLQAMRAMQSAPTVSPAVTPEAPVKRKPGRPRKNTVASPVAPIVAPVQRVEPESRGIVSATYGKRTASASVHINRDGTKASIKLMGCIPNDGFKPVYLDLGSFALLMGLFSEQTDAMRQLGLSVERLNASLKK